MKRHPLLAREQAQIAFAQRRKVFGSGHRTERRRGIAGAVIDQGFAADTGAAPLAARVGLHDFVGAPEAERPALGIGLRNRRRQQIADAHDQPRHLARLVVEGRAVARIQRRRLLPVGDEDQRRRARQQLGDADAAVHALGDLAVAGPGHSRVDLRQGRAQLAQVRADLDRREQQERAVLGEDGPAELRAARQLQQRLAQGVLGEREARDRLAIELRVGDVHALRHIEHHHMLEARAHQTNAGVQETGSQRDCGGDEQPAIGVVTERSAQRGARRVAQPGPQPRPARHGSPGE